jgi:hypothetical protein
VIRAVAFCPHPPLLIPEVAHGAADELADLRGACREAIRQVAAPDSQLLVIGSGERTRLHLPTARGSLAPYGVDLEIPLGSEERGPVELPLSLTIGAWLVRDALGANCGASGLTVDATGAELRGIDTDTARTLVVMGDGSARRSTTAPGYFDERAGAFDEGVAAALASGDGSRLRFDTSLAAELLAAGVPAWNVAGRWLGSDEHDARVLYDAAPYGVGYFVAAWTRRA